MNKAYSSVTIEIGSNSTENQLVAEVVMRKATEGCELVSLQETSQAGSRLVYLVFAKSEGETM
jgi:hypothetical protein